MLWESFLRLIKEEDGYGTVELMIILVAVVSIGYSVASTLTKDVFAPVHQKSVENMKTIRNSGY